MRGQERADSLKSVVFRLFWVGVLGFCSCSFSPVSPENPHAPVHARLRVDFFSVCGDSFCVKTRLRPQERADSRASICVCGPIVCVCGKLRFLGFYNGFLAFFDIFENFGNARA